MGKEIQMRWLGSAAFEIRSESVVLIDPFLRRNRKAYPIQELKPKDFSRADYIFVSHGHSDHAIDVPEISRSSGAKIFCSPVTAKFLIRKNMDPSRITLIESNREFFFPDFSVRALLCEHSKVDIGIILRSMPQLLSAVPGLLVDFLTMPAGPLIVFLFDFSGLRILHMGSLPNDYENLLPELAGNTDIALIPLRGRSDIAEIAADFSSSIKPTAIVVQHHDNFSPPLSPPVDVESFRRKVKEVLPETAFYEPEMNVTFSPTSLLPKGPDSRTAQ